MTEALERGWVVSSTPGPHFTPGKEPVPILQEAGWVPGPFWTGGKSLPHLDSIPDRPARSQSLYRLSNPAHTLLLLLLLAFRYNISTLSSSTLHWVTNVSYYLHHEVSSRWSGTLSHPDPSVLSGWPKASVLHEHFASPQTNRQIKETMGHLDRYPIQQFNKLRIIPDLEVKIWTCGLWIRSPSATYATVIFDLTHYTTAAMATWTNESRFLKYQAKN